MSDFFANMLCQNTVTELGRSTREQQAVNLQNAVRRSMPEIQAVCVRESKLGNFSAKFFDIFIPFAPELDVFMRNSNNNTSHAEELILCECPPNLYVQVTQHSRNGPCLVEFMW